MKSKVLISFLLIVIMLSFQPIVLASDSTDILQGKSEDDFKPTLEGGGTDFDNIVGNILGGIQIFGIIVSVFSMMIIGIKGMVGSVEEKNQVKQAMFGYIIGFAMVVLMTSLPNMIYNAAKDL